MEPKSLRFSEERLKPADIEYLRADVAKEREAKLIEAASNYADAARYLDNIDIKVIYKAAGLEELK